MATEIVTVGTTATTIFDEPTAGAPMGFEVQNLGSVAFNSFTVAGQVGSGDWSVFASVASDWTSIPSGSLIRFSDGTSPVTLAGDAAAAFGIDTQYYSRIRMQATVASGSTTALVQFHRGRLRG